MSRSKKIGCHHDWKIRADGTLRQDAFTFRFPNCVVRLELQRRPSNLKRVTSIVIHRPREGEDAEDVAEGMTCNARSLLCLIQTILDQLGCQGGNVPILLSALTGHALSNIDFAAATWGFQEHMRTPFLTTTLKQLLQTKLVDMCNKQQIRSDVKHIALRLLE